MFWECDSSCCGLGLNQIWIGTRVRHVKVVLEIHFSYLSKLKRLSILIDIPALLTNDYMLKSLDCFCLNTQRVWMYKSIKGNVLAQYLPTEAIENQCYIQTVPTALLIFKLLFFMPCWSLMIQKGPILHIQTQSAFLRTFLKAGLAGEIIVTRYSFSIFLLNHIFTCNFRILISNLV